MNYSALIENRKSVRAFEDRHVPTTILEEIRTYFTKSVKRLVPELKTMLYFFGPETGEVLEGAAGYNHFLIGAPQYLVQLSEKGKQMEENAGYMMEDMVLKLTELNLDSCWLTFTDSDHVKHALGIESELDVAAIVAFGYGKKTTRRLRLNIFSMSNVDIKARRHYFEPKRSIDDLVFVGSWGNTSNLDQQIGFFDDMLWEAFRAAALAPSYLNRQAYGFVIHDGNVTLVRRPDAYTTEIDGKLSLGIALLHFTAVAENWAGSLQWRFGKKAAKLELPEGHEVIASCAL